MQIQYLVLIRHGNTFSPGEKVVWAGTTNDLPLSDSGIKQAQLIASVLGVALKNSDVSLYSSPLLRARTTASYIQQELGVPIRVDSRINEIDYGHWTGKSNQELSEAFGKTELDAWEVSSVWPEKASWGDNERIESNRVIEFSRNTQSKFNLVVSHNGKLRYFLKLDSKLWDSHLLQKKFKIKTGNVSVLKRHNGQTEVVGWDLSPEEFRKLDLR